MWFTENESDMIYITLWRILFWAGMGTTVFSQVPHFSGEIWIAPSWKIKLNHK